MSNLPSFGGDWSDAKLSVIREYMQSYCTALSQTSFERIYIDAFAGAGARNVEANADAVDEEGLGLPDAAVDAQEDAAVRHGSPLQALATEPGFHRFIFIEQAESSMAELKRQVAGSGLLGSRRIEFLMEDANAALERLTSERWNSKRAVAFLDPFALHVKWATVEAIAKTQAIDMWLLFPAMAVNRMLPRSGKVPPVWANRLDETFGDTAWRSEFYDAPYPTDLFGDSSVDKTPRPFERLSSYLTKRLGTVFASTHDEPLMLRTSSGSPLFLLCFGCGNPKGAPIARRIAQYLINKSRGR
jgi:three-Cys-motif partner protein